LQNKTFKRPGPVSGPGGVPEKNPFRLSRRAIAERPEAGAKDLRWQGAWQSAWRGASRLQGARAG